MKFNPFRIWEAFCKCAIWTFILAICLNSFTREEWISIALADYVQIRPTQTRTATRTAANGSLITYPEVMYGTFTVTSTLTGTRTETGLTTNTNTGSSTDTNCHTGGAQYGGGQWGACTRGSNNNQDNSQEDTKGLNDNGANQSTMLGLAAIAAGMAMVAAGMALLPAPPTTPIGVALIAAGMALIAAGMAALAAASKMNNNANKAGNNAYKMDNLNPYQSTISNSTSTNAGTGTSTLGDVKKVDVGDGTTSGIKIDPALLRNGKLDGIYGDLEKKTGLNRDEFANAMAGGANPLALLSNSPALRGKASASEGNLQKMMDDTLAKGNPPNADEMMNQLGLTSEDLGVVAPGGGGARAPSAAAQPNIDSLFPVSGDTKAGASGGDFMKISPEVQAALDKNGIVHGRTIFEMVHSQYVKKTPLMFGVHERKINGTADNPYLGGEKIEF